MNTRLLILIGRSHVWMSEDAIIRQKSEKAQELVSPCASVSKRCAIVLMWCDASCRRPKRPVLQAARGTALPNLDSHHVPAYHSPAQSNSNRLIPCSAQTGLNQQISPAQAGRYTAWLRQPQHRRPSTAQTGVHRPTQTGQPLRPQTAAVQPITACPNPDRRSQAHHGPVQLSPTQLSPAQPGSPRSSPSQSSPT